MTSKVSTCLYVDREVLETVHNVGPNVSKVAENAFVEAIGRLSGTKPATGLMSRPPVNMEGRAGI
jgi:post-segregation antitoxin (ccd killing protein)